MIDRHTNEVICTVKFLIIYLELKIQITEIRKYLMVCIKKLKAFFGLSIVYFLLHE